MAWDWAKALLKRGKALIIRLIFMYHGYVTVEHVVNVFANPTYYWLCVPMIFMVIEYIITTKCTKAGGWKWLCPSVFLYLICVVPGLWLLHYDAYYARHNHKLSLGLPDCDHTPSDINGTGLHHSHQVDAPLFMNAEEWTLALEQILLIILIVGRWVLPKGKLSRDELSQLLLVFLGEAADTLEFSLESLKEEDVICNLTLILIILSIWSMSLLQFGLIISSPEGSTSDRCCDTEILSLWVSVGLQDAPYLMMRLYLIIQFHLVDQMLLFFTCKNILVVVLQLYRMIILRRTRAQKKTEQAKNENSPSLPYTDAPVKDDGVSVAVSGKEKQFSENFNMS